MIYAIYICDNTTIANSQFDYADLPESGYIRICTNEIYLDFAESLWHCAWSKPSSPMCCNCQFILVH